MSTIDFRDLVDARLPSNVYMERAPNDTTGTYAVLRLDLYGRSDPSTRLMDVRIDVYSQASGAEAHDLADDIESLLAGWSPHRSCSSFKVGSIQHVPADQSDPLTTRLTMAATAVWAFSDVTDTGGVSA